MKLPVAASKPPPNTGEDRSYLPNSGNLPIQQNLETPFEPQSNFGTCALHLSHTNSLPTRNQPKPTCQAKGETSLLLQSAHPCLTPPHPPNHSVNSPTNPTFIHLIPPPPPHTMSSQIPILKNHASRSHIPTSASHNATRLPSCMLLTDVDHTQSHPLVSAPCIPSVFPYPSRHIPPAS